MRIVSNASYSGVDLSCKAHSGDALDSTFRNANMHGANLSSVRNLTRSQIVQATCSFHAIVPLHLRLFTSKRCKCGQKFTHVEPFCCFN